MRAKTLIVIVALAILLLFGLYEVRAYCDPAAIFARKERNGTMFEPQSFVCGWFSRE